MKTMHILIPALLAGIALSAAAETKTSAAQIKKPVTQWTCREFIALGNQYKPKAVYWASAYAKGGEPEASELDIDGTEQITPGIVQDCEREPESSFWQKLKAAWEKVEAEAKTMEKKM
ncbi:MAG: acid-activated periplasmic chaperone HdeA [Gammaproteobacteria bacterium]